MIYLEPIVWKSGMVSSLIYVYLEGIYFIFGNDYIFKRIGYLESGLQLGLAFGQDVPFPLHDAHGCEISAV